MHPLMLTTFPENEMVLARELFVLLMLPHILLDRLGHVRRTSWLLWSCGFREPVLLTHISNPSLAITKCSLDKDASFSGDRFIALTWQGTRKLWLNCALPHCSALIANAWQICRKGSRQLLGRGPYSQHIVGTAYCPCKVTVHNSTYLLSGVPQA